VCAAVTSDAAGQEAARERAVQALAKAQNISVDQARSQVAEFDQQYRQFVDQAKRQATAAGRRDGYGRLPEEPCSGQSL
jgi:ribulose kinase